MTAKELFIKIKAAFDAPPAVDPSLTAPTDPSTAVVFSYAVAGGSTVYVDCSDDGIADIDMGDKVYTDPAMTIPYPDGTYTVAGTDFGFTVAGGIVTVVVDADGTGPGLPIEQAAAAPAAAAAPPTPPAPPPGPTTEQRVAALEAAVAKLTPPPVTTGMATELELKAASQKIDKHEQTIISMFELIEKLVVIPSAEPKTLTGAKKERFEKAQSKEAKLEGIAQAIRKMKEEKNN